jgi:(+)-abscisic acid 8'-hydroxylase
VVLVWFAGFLIPKGWKVMPLFRNMHYSPDYFQDPHKFDPSRFKVMNGLASLANGGQDA